MHITSNQNRPLIIADLREQDPPYPSGLNIKKVSSETMDKGVP